MNLEELERRLAEIKMAKDQSLANYQACNGAEAEILNWIAKEKEKLLDLTCQ